MRQKILTRRFWAWLITAVAGICLLTLGYWFGRQSLEPRLNRALRTAAEQADQSGRVRALNQSLEKRLARLEARLDECRGRGGALPGPEPAQAVTKVLSRGRTALALGGRLALTLEKVLRKPNQAVIGIRAADGKSGRAALSVGSQVKIKVDGRIYLLILKQLHAASATVAIKPE